MSGTVKLTSVSAEMDGHIIILQYPQSQKLFNVPPTQTGFFCNYCVGSISDWPVRFLCGLFLSSIIGSTVMRCQRGGWLMTIMGGASRYSMRDRHNTNLMSALQYRLIILYPDPVPEPGPEPWRSSPGSREPGFSISTPGNQDG